jgi:hypothetical protein
MTKNKDMIIRNNDMNLFSISASLSSYLFQSGERRAGTGAIPEALSQITCQRAKSYDPDMFNCSPIDMPTDLEIPDM